jgi:hypothetical protein
MGKPELLDQAKAAEYLRARGLSVAVSTLEKWRHQGRGPSYRKLGHRVRYDAAGLEAFIDNAEVTTA